MPKLKADSVPKYRHHRARGLAVVTDDLRKAYVEWLGVDVTRNRFADAMHKKGSVAALASRGPNKARKVFNGIKLTPIEPQ